MAHITGKGTLFIILLGKAYRWENDGYFTYEEEVKILTYKSITAVIVNKIY